MAAQPGRVTRRIAPFTERALDALARPEPLAAPRHARPHTVFRRRRQGVHQQQRLRGAHQAPPPAAIRILEPTQLVCERRRIALVRRSGRAGLSPCDQCLQDRRVEQPILQPLQRTRQRFRPHPARSPPDCNASLHARSNSTQTIVTPTAHRSL